MYRRIIVFQIIQEMLKSSHGSRIGVSAKCHLLDLNFNKCPVYSNRSYKEENRNKNKQKYYDSLQKDFITIKQYIEYYRVLLYMYIHYT